MKVVLAATLVLAVTPQAFAHASLKSTTPAANASVKAPSRITLEFSEVLEPAFSGATLSDAAGKTVPVPSAVGGKTITLLPLSMRPGAYSVTWHSVGHDTHRVTGSFHFTVAN